MDAFMAQFQSKAPSNSVKTQKSIKDKKEKKKKNKSPEHQEGAFKRVKKPTRILDSSPEASEHSEPDNTNPENAEH